MTSELTLSTLAAIKQTAERVCPMDRIVHHVKFGSRSWASRHVAQNGVRDGGLQAGLGLELLVNWSVDVATFCLRSNPRAG